jgi:site-specific recombinase XerD
MKRIGRPALSVEDQQAFDAHVATLRQLNDEEENAQVAAVKATGTLRDRTINALLLHRDIRARELCILTRKQVHQGKRNGMLCIVGNRNKIRDVPCNETTRVSLQTYLAPQPMCSLSLFSSEKMHEALPERVLRNFIKKYTRSANVADVSPHNLRHHLCYLMAEVIFLCRLAPTMGHDSLDTMKLYSRDQERPLTRGGENCLGLKTPAILVLEHRYCLTAVLLMDVSSLS